VSRTEQILRADPSGVYPLMDEGSRESYRQQLEKLAAKRSIPEYRVAQRALRMSSSATAQQERHVGYWLFRRPLGEAPRSQEGGGYVAANLLITLFISLFAGFAANSLWLPLLLLVPVSELTKTILDRFLQKHSRPVRLPRMELKNGVGAEGRTVCVVSLLLTGRNSVDEATDRLEEFRLASRDCGRELYFALLADLPESDEQESKTDKELLLYAARAVEKLNRRFGSGFYLLCRERTWQRSSGRWSGWERKRGAVMELARLLCGEESSILCSVGDGSALRRCRFILTLDADTRLTPGAARSLIGAMLHPLNRPMVDEKRRIVTAGHALIQPRIATDLKSALRCGFARLFSPQGGADPYGGCAGELYMDRFASGGFAGKGILDARALLICLDKRIPEGRVLSHDALEGAFLRGGLMEDVELTDAFPASPLSYYRRQHRWVRGDWQNLPWLFGAGRDLRGIERWRLFDSLRRSLLSPALLTALVLPLFLPSPITHIAAAIAVLTLCAPMLLSLLSAAKHKREEVRVRLLSPLIHGFPGAFTAVLARLWLLPHEAWVNLSAAATALWRMGVTKRGLLEWQTAAQSDGCTGSLKGCYRAMLPTLLLGLGCLFAPTIAGKAMGVVWLLAPLALADLGRETPRRGSTLPSSERSWLLQRAGEIWHYFDNFCAAEDHFLPPDNFQELPPVGIAHRSSPTNIGLALTAALSALDLGVAPRPRVMELIENILATVEQLPKWHGHLYNWYDTRTLQPLHPAYVSTVDSGNLAAALTALQQGLLEYGAKDLAKRTGQLSSAMDFSKLYDEKRQLFRIGINCEGESSESWYDLLESEERLCAYFCIATGQVPKKHWQCLSRAQLGLNGYRGCASWSGTMFEYLMPELFLPLHSGSLLAESARFCLYVQKKERFGPLGIWGKSESAFYSLDSALNYRYKAHGCQKLALCRGMDAEQVAAPYASFLAMMVERKASLENLHRFEKHNMLGPYGFWEALDFTPERCGSAAGVPVRCVMAHHLGMSMTAIANVCCGSVWQQRFMKNRAMAAYDCLLQEKLPLGGLLLRRRDFTVPTLPRPRSEATALRQGEGTNFLLPACQPLSNGIYSLIVSESGLSLPDCSGYLPYRSPRLPVGDGVGLELWLRRRGELLPLLPAMGAEGRFCWDFSAGKAVLRGESGDLRWSLASAVSIEESGERRLITMESDLEEDAELYVCFEPVLAPGSDYRNHPAYARLGLFSQKQQGTLLISRLPRGKSPALHLAAGSLPRGEWTTGRKYAPGREDFREAFGWNSAMLCSLRLPLHLGKKAATVTLAIAMAAGENDALESAGRLLRGESEAAMAETAGRLLGMDGTAVTAALDTLPALLFPHVDTIGRMSGADSSRDALWSHGISGDDPIVSFPLSGDERLPAAAEELRRHALLSACGVRYDLVFLSDEQGDYRRSRSAALEELLRKMGRDGLIGRKGGIHFADAATATDAVNAVAALCSDSMSAAPTLTLPPAQPGARGGTPDYYWDENLSFRFRCESALPPRAWCHMLTNGRFGALISESSTGFLWYKNARECPISPWSGDIYAEKGPETLEFYQDGQWQSVFAARGSTTHVTYGFGWAAFEKCSGGITLRLTVWVPPDGAERRMQLHASAPLPIRWCLPLQLGSEKRDAIAVQTTLDRSGRFRAVSRRCPFPDLTLEASCSAAWTRTATDRQSFLAGGEEKPLRCGEPCFAGEFLLEDTAELCVGTERSGEGSLEATQQHWRAVLDRCRGKTGDEELDHLLGGWAQYQALAGRILGRCSLYQQGGAIGFRDQLQDRVNTLPLDTAGCRAHILDCCAHQFEEGDVQHWWHEGVGDTHRGVRTRCSDDLLWLPWAVCEYVRFTDDISICRETAPYLTAPPLAKEEDSRYELPERSEKRGSVLEHCRAALDLVLRRGSGSHGLLLMGSGDWNDGLDGLGEGGESTWLTFFYARCAHDFAELLERLGESGAAWYRKAARSAVAAGEKAWDGQCWLRGWYGDAAPLGKAGDEGGVDAVVQSFGAMAPGVDPEHAETALSTAVESLYDAEQRICRIFTAPYTQRGRSPGYISAYGPGFRENGGQYTHAALFLARALFQRGRREEAERILRCAVAEGRRSAVYEAEPYVIPADIYANPDCYGRGGWSWYTGSAGWFFRVAMEDLLGQWRQNS